MEIWRYAWFLFSYQTIQSVNYSKITRILTDMILTGTAILILKYVSLSLWNCPMNCGLYHAKVMLSCSMVSMKQPVRTFDRSRKTDSSTTSNTFGHQSLLIKSLITFQFMQLLYRCPELLNTQKIHCVPNFTSFVRIHCFWPNENNFLENCFLSLEG